jgi:hypothetical protein
MRAIGLIEDGGQAVERSADRASGHRCEIASNCTLLKAEASLWLLLRIHFLGRVTVGRER